MCLTPIKIATRSRLLYANTMPKVFNYVKCGNCAECQQNIKTEWMYRTYYEAKDTFNRGGYIIFDTLTYNENTIPWSKDIVKRDYGLDIPEELNFRCFDYTDVQKFFKRLRKNLSGYGKGLFTYKLAAEYGTKKECTHRSHYHIIFFIKDGTIDPLIFSHIVRKSWDKGITDGVDDKGILYFNTNRLFKDSKQGVINAVGYISKYINKDSEYSKIIREKVGEIEKYFDDFDCNYKNTNQGKIRKLSLRRSLNQFSRNSSGYGISAMNEMNEDLIWNEGKVNMPDAYNVSRKLTLPMYYYRKLFQKYDKNLKTWKFTEIGFKYKKKRLFHSIDTLTNVYENKISNAIQIGDCKIEDRRTKLLLNEKNRAEIANNILSLLRKRSLRDYAIYKIFYQDRLINENDTIYSVNSFISHFNDDSDILYKMYVSPDKQNFCGLERIVEKVNPFECPAIIDFDRCVSFDRFVQYRVLDSSKMEIFMDFEKIDNEFRKLSKNENVQKQIYYDWLCKQRKKMKNSTF